MRLTDSFEEESNQKMPIVYMMLGVSIFIALILAFTLYLNREEFSERVGTSGYEAVRNQEDEMLQSQGHTLDELLADEKGSAQDLDIWTPDDFTEEVDTTPAYEVETQLALQEAEEEKKLEQAEKDPSVNGTKTMIKTDKGEEWITINPYIAKNQYDILNLTYDAPEMLYFVDGKQVSTFGITINEAQAMIDFNLAKKDGVDFAMIQLGSRGYESGKLTTDSYFKAYTKGAKDAGIDVGIYFSSQAVTEEEITEEVAYMVEQIGDYPVTYPVVLRMDSVSYDNARTDELDRVTRTELVKFFVEEIEEAGYIPMLYGTKEFLLKDVELSQLADVDIWLANSGDVPDYPYEFHIWQYNTMAKIDGIAGMTNINVSFIDYTKK